jgi:hypothetical protein
LKAPKGRKEISPGQGIHVVGEAMKACLQQAGAKEVYLEMATWKKLGMHP